MNRTSAEGYNDKLPNAYGHSSLFGMFPDTARVLAGEYPDLYVRGHSPRAYLVWPSNTGRRIFIAWERRTEQ